MQVLLLTDFSPNAKIMQDYALNFFGNKNVHFIMMHALRPCEISKCSGLCSKKREADLEVNYQNLKKRLKSGQTLSKIFINNNLVDAVRNYIEKSHIDMILMGGKGKTSNVNKQFGKNTYDIVTKIRCPILVVFENSVVKIPGKIVFPLDYTISVKKNYFDFVSQLNFWKHIDLSILEVPNKMFNSVLSQKINKQKITKTFKEIDYHFTTLKPFDKIGFCDNCKNADMIMFMAKNLNISNRIFSELGKNKLNPQTPLLVLHG
jgi:hypothetical protein